MTDGTRDRASGGYTLTELLVSVGILALIGSVLVGILKSGLDMWDRGETRRDVVERAHVVMGDFAREIPRMFCEMDARPPATTAKPLELLVAPADATAPGSPGRPGMFCDFDKAGNQRLRFSRPGTVILAAPVTASGGETQKDEPEKKEKEEEEEEEAEDGLEAETLDFTTWADELRTFSDVAWVLHPAPEGGDRLWRVFVEKPVQGETPFPEARFGTEKALQDAGGAVVASGVLYLRYRFWSHTTTTWDASVAPAPVAGAAGGPETRWDSTRTVMPEFTFYLDRTSRLAPPPDVLPARVQVELAVEPDTRKRSWATLRADLDSGDTEIDVDSTLGFPDAPGLVRIEGEWISYKEKSRTRFTVDKRGVRDTKAAAHKKDVRVLWGETFLATFAVRNHRAPRAGGLPVTSGSKKK